MDLSQSVTFTITYMNKNIRIIADIYEMISELFMKTKEASQEDGTFLKKKFEDKYKDITDAFDDAKKDRESFISSIENVRKHKKDEDIQLKVFHYHDIDDKLNNLDLMCIKLFRIIKKYEEICDDLADNMDEDNIATLHGALATSVTYDFKRSRITTLKISTKRLLNLIDSNRRFLGSITGDYDESPHKEELSKD